MSRESALTRLSGGGGGPASAMVWRAFEGQKKKDDGRVGFTLREKKKRDVDEEKLLFREPATFGLCF